MNSFRDFLEDLCLSTGIRFNLFEDNDELYHGLDDEVSETIKTSIELGEKEFWIYIEKKFKDNIKLINYIIADKYKELYSIREKLMVDLLNGEKVEKDLIEKSLSFLQSGAEMILINVEKSRNEALDIARRLYLGQEVISFIYEEDIVILGLFEDVEEHAKSIKESIISHLYCKCYVSFGTKVYEAKKIIDCYKNIKESMMLGKKFQIKDEVFSYDKTIFEKIIFNIEPSVKKELMSRFKNKFDVFDRETINTIEEFMDCGLNISDASKKLYIHRNTLIYRIEKIKKETGFDIRQFTDATIFRILFFMWKESLHS